MSIYLRPSVNRFNIKCIPDSEVTSITGLYRRDFTDNRCLERYVFLCTKYGIDISSIVLKDLTRLEIEEEIRKFILGEELEENLFLVTTLDSSDYEEDFQYTIRAIDKEHAFRIACILGDFSLGDVSIIEIETFDRCGFIQTSNRRC